MVTAAKSSWWPVVRNAVSLLASDALNRATTFVLYALVARYITASAFGQLSLTLTFFYTFQVFATVGLPTHLTRLIASDRSRTSELLVNGGFLSIVGSLCAMLVVFVVVYLMDYERDTAQLIMLLSLGLIPYALSSVLESVFRGWERMQYIALANVPANVAKVVAAYYFLEHGYGVSHVVLAILGCRLGILFIELGLMFCCVCRPRHVINLKLSVEMARSAATFLGIDGVIALQAAATVILLSKMMSETEVGLYSAAAQLLVPLTLVNMNITISIFPLLCRKFDRSLIDAGLKQASDRLLEVLLAIAIPGTIGLICVSRQAIDWVYDNPDFVPAVDVLRVMAFTMVLRAISTALGHMLYAGRKERVTLLITLVDLVASVVFSLIFIHYYGLLGAGIAALLTRVVDCLQHYVPVSRLVSSISITKLCWKAMLASAVMAAMILVIRDRGVGFLPCIVAGAALYTAVFALLFVWTNQRLGHTWARF